MGISIQDQFFRICYGWLQWALLNQPDPRSVLPLDYCSFCGRTNENKNVSVTGRWAPPKIREDWIRAGLVATTRAIEKGFFYGSGYNMSVLSILQIETYTTKKTLFPVTIRNGHLIPDLIAVQ